MQNLLANLYRSLVATITALQDGDGKPYFRYVDQELGQLEYHAGDNRPPVSWPCVLIDIDNIAYQALSENVQTGNARIIFRIGFPPFSASSGITPAAYRDKAIYYYELEQILYAALSDHRPQYIATVDGEEQDLLADAVGPLTRVSAITEAREDFIRVRVVNYSLNIEDYSARHNLTLTPITAIDLTSDLDL